MTRDAATLLQELTARGVHLESRGDRLRVEDPAGVLTDADVEVLRRMKPQLLALLGASTRQSARWRDGCSLHGETVDSVAQRWQSACGGACETCRAVGVPETGEQLPVDQVGACCCCGGPCLLSDLVCTRCSEEAAS